MKQYGDNIPFYGKKSGWWPNQTRKTWRYESKRSRNTEEKQRAGRWMKRLERRLGKYIIDEQQREMDLKKIHV
jgi:hypothetical protein